MRRLGSAGASLVELVLLDRFDLSARFLQDARTTALFETGALRRRLVEALGGEEVRTVPGVDLAIQVVDAEKGSSIRYVTRSTKHTKGSGYEVVPAITVDMVLASASIPLLFPAVTVNGRRLWDGGVLVNTPLAPLVDLGATEIVTVLVTEAADARRAPFDNVGDALERVTDTLLDNTYNVDRKLLLERNRVAGKDPRRYRAVSLYEPIRPGGADAVFTVGSYLDFHERAIEDMTEAGRGAAEAWLKRGPRLDRL
jgi:NTE family protein